MTDVINQIHRTLDSPTVLIFEVMQKKQCIGVEVWHWLALSLSCPLILWLSAFRPPTFYLFIYLFLFCIYLIFNSGGLCHTVISVLSSLRCAAMYILQLTPV